MVGWRISPPFQFPPWKPTAHHLQRGAGAGVPILRSAAISRDVSSIQYFSSGRSVPRRLSSRRGGGRSVPSGARRQGRPVQCPPSNPQRLFQRNRCAIITPASPLRAETLRLILRQGSKSPSPAPSDTHARASRPDSKTWSRGFAYANRSGSLRKVVRPGSLRPAIPSAMQERHPLWHRGTGCCWTSWTSSQTPTNRSPAHLSRFHLPRLPQLSPSPRTATGASRAGMRGKIGSPGKAPCQPAEDRP